MFEIQRDIVEFFELVWLFPGRSQPNLLDAGITAPSLTHHRDCTSVVASGALQRNAMHYPLGKFSSLDIDTYINIWGGL